MASSSLLDDDVFWQRVRAAPRRFLGLDYDGTLAPFTVDRLAALPAPGAVAALAAITAGPDRVAIISGRRLEEVLALLGDSPGADLLRRLVVIGSHGYEVRRAGQPVRQIPLSPAQRRGLDRADEALRALGHAVRLERKAASLAFHTRGVDRPLAARLEAQAETVFTAAAAVDELDLRRFDGGVELRAVGVDKGTALTDLLAELPDDTLCLHVGDDRTDEDAFEAVQARGGLGVKVGPARGYESRAGAHLADCAEVVRFLARWRDEVRR